MTGPSMTAGERGELARLARMRAKVARSQVEHRAAELYADVEAKLAAVYKFSDEAWADVTAAAELAVREADRQIAERCEKLGIPSEFRPGLHLGWYGRGENAVTARRTELRAVARRRIDADAKHAKAAIEAASVEVQTQLLADGLTSDAAHAFLRSMPTPAQLMPVLDIAVLEIHRPKPRSAVAATAAEDPSP